LVALEKGTVLMPVVENMDSAQTSLLAHELMLRLLISSEKNRSPFFAAEARRSVDEFLGHLPPGPPNEYFVEARAKLIALLDTTDDLFGREAPAMSMSLRRRFLLWLLDG
jgi:hypothetical protein